MWDVRSDPGPENGHWWESCQNLHFVCGLVRSIVSALISLFWSLHSGSRKCHHYEKPSEGYLGTQVLCKSKTNSNKSWKKCEIIIVLKRSHSYFHPLVPRPLYSDQKWKNTTYSPWFKALLCVFLDSAFVYLASISYGITPNLRLSCLHRPWDAELTLWTTSSIYFSNTKPIFPCPKSILVQYT